MSVSQKILFINNSFWKWGLIEVSEQVEFYSHFDFYTQSFGFLYLLNF